jgi:hypothetical protein
MIFSHHVLKGQMFSFTKSARRRRRETLHCGAQTLYEPLIALPKNLIRFYVNRDGYGVDTSPLGPSKVSDQQQHLALISRRLTLAVIGSRGSGSNEPDLDPVQRSAG